MYCDIDDCNDPAKRLSEKAIEKLEENFFCFLTYIPKHMCLGCMIWMNTTSDEFEFVDGEIKAYGELNEGKQDGTL